METFTMPPHVIKETAHSKTALTPPTSEEWNKRDGSASDLTDLDFHVENLDVIEPDHYYDGGRIPVFKPTMEQFRSFKNYIGKIDKYGMKSGIVKVIPPKEWTDALPALDNAVKSIKVKNPITQEFAGTHGTYTQANIEKQRSYNLPQWKALTEESQHQPPARRGERRRNQTKPTKAISSRTKSHGAQSIDSRTRRRGPGRPRKRNQKSLATEVQLPEQHTEELESFLQGPPTPTSPKIETDSTHYCLEQDPESRPCQTYSSIERDERPKKPLSNGTKAKSISERRKYNRQETAEHVDETAFEGFDYRFHSHDEFTAERCAELEALYWKGLTFAPPMYGADMPGSLFDDSTTSWNVAKLENLLDVLGQKIPGVNTAYLYLGMWKATFAWHLEDVDLYSINYIHFGAPKQWYSISQEDARRFENAMRSVWPTDAKNCSQFLRHKTYLISPGLLQSQFNIRVNKLVHYEGEFVITFPYGYHSGYNLGYNCAESVNFATEAWLEYGKIAKKCDCEADSVWVNVEEIERKLRGEPTPEYCEETDDDDLEALENRSLGVSTLPSPPASILGKHKLSGRKRKLDLSSSAGQKGRKKIKIRIKNTETNPCILCPNEISSERLLRTESGRSAHRSCALFTPETYISEDDNGNELVRNVDSIGKARLGLKCSYCRSKKGACFQCSSRKCTRAFHATCAAPAGVQIDYGPTSVYGEDGIEYIGEAYDFRCRFHRTRRSKTVTSDSLEENALIRTAATLITPKDTIQFQFLHGEILAGAVIENRNNEHTFLVDILPQGDRIEVDWKWLLTLDPNDSQLPKPSKHARPLPLSMSRCATQPRNSEFGPPLPDDSFCDPKHPFRWAEFNLGPSTSNSSQEKVNLGMSNQIWLYLGEHSTEAKAYYTDDSTKHYPNQAANFLESVRRNLQYGMYYANPPSRAEVELQTYVSHFESQRSWSSKPKQDQFTAGMTNDSSCRYRMSPMPTWSVSVAHPSLGKENGSRQMLHHHGATSSIHHVDASQTLQDVPSCSCLLFSALEDCKQEHLLTRSCPFASANLRGASRSGMCQVYNASSKEQMRGASAAQRLPYKSSELANAQQLHQLKVANACQEEKEDLPENNFHTGIAKPNRDSTSQDTDNSHFDYGKFCNTSICALTGKATSHMIHIARYPFLLNSLLRRPRAYKSPYDYDSSHKNFLSKT